MSRQLSSLVLFALLSCTLVLADRVILKNGDHLTGTVVKSDGKTLLLHTESAGDITIKFAAIEQISTDEEVHVGLKDRKVVVGPVTTRDGRLEVATANSGTVEAAKEDVALIRNDAEQTAYDNSLHPGLRHGWESGLNVGFALARGNSQTENLAVAFTAVHPTLHDKITMYESSVYAKNDAGTPSTIANVAQGGIRYDRDIRPRLFAFVGADFMADALQGLNLRSVGSVGLGFHVIKNENTVLDLLGGGNFTNENYTETVTLSPPPGTITRKIIHNSGGLTLGEELMHKLGESTVLTQKLGFFPNLTDAGQYRGNFEFGTVTKISKWLGWQNQFGDIYVSNPPPGKKKNDVIFTTGLNISIKPGK